MAQLSKPFSENSDSQIDQKRQKPASLLYSLRCKKIWKCVRRYLQSTKNTTINYVNYLIRGEYNKPS
ncbi:hypothetical protein RN001_009676 [Aquatica leii]|uniref:Uncharacterized protein n=1 Tax=Aquatica leii TaxID=1421715 RepID=A0AAN7SQ12_9COLE|nr:hypothetical protein RN001_009676 [Aquatica leii]